MSTTLRLDTGILKTATQTGVTKFTYLLAHALRSHKSVQFSTINLNPPLFRAYTKLNSFNLAPPIDIFLPEVDLTIFPNFATWPTVKSKRVATVIHDLTYLYFPEAVEGKNLAHLRRVVPRSVKNADLIITVSESVKSEIVKEFNIVPEKCVVTPIQPDQIFFSNLDDRIVKAVKEKHAIDKKYIYFLGTFEPRKNLKTLIEAYRLLPDHTKYEYSLVLAGGKGWNNGSAEGALQEALAAGEDIKHLGFIDQNDSPALYQGASLFVLPSFYEGFGMPVLEAMASGTPVVASDLPVFKEIGSSLITYADPNDARTFADAIMANLEAARPSREAFITYLNRFSWNENVIKIIEAAQTVK